MTFPTVRSSLLGLGALSALAMTLPLQAEEERIVVTATRTAQTADATLAPVIVIDRADIERNPGASVEDLLILHAGVEIGRTGGIGQQTSVFIRGANSTHTLVLVDGVRINAIGGAAAIQNIDPTTIERIEIVKGPRATLYGSDAIGGVINIITRRAEEGVKYRVSAGAGSFGTRSANVAIHALQGNSTGGINVSRVRSDGIPTLTDSELEQGYERDSVHAYFGHRFGHTEVRLSHWESEGNVEYLAGVPADQDFTNRATSLTLQAPVSDDWVSTLSLSQMEDIYFGRIKTREVDWQNDVQIGEAQLMTVGAHFAREQAEGFGFTETVDAKAVFVQDAVQLGRHSFVAGARYNDHERLGSRSTWNVDYGFDVATTVRLLAAAGTGYRAPTSADRFAPWGNPDLDAETSRNLELGLRWRPAPAHAVRLSAFDNRIDDLINWDSTTFSMQNIDRARIRGVELGYAYRVADWSLSADAIWQDPENREDGSQLLRRAKQKATVGAAYRMGRYTLGGDIAYTGERQDFGGSLDPYTLVNLTAQARLGKGITLAARAENVTDEDYELAAGYNTPGRSGFLELRFEH